jgi:hypothetical protein
LELLRRAQQSTQPCSRLNLDHCSSNESQRDVWDKIEHQDCDDVEDEELKIQSPNRLLINAEHFSVHLARPTLQPYDFDHCHDQEPKVDDGAPS